MELYEGMDVKAVLSPEQLEEFRGLVMAQVRLSLIKREMQALVDVVEKTIETQDKRFFDALLASLGTSREKYGFEMNGRMELDAENPEITDELLPSITLYSRAEIEKRKARTELPPEIEALLKAIPGAQLINIGPLDGEDEPQDTDTFKLQKGED